MNKIALSVLLALIALVATAPAASAAAQPKIPKWTDYDRPAENGVITEDEVPITMSDGVKLRAKVLRPDKPGKYPVIVTQTPYNKVAFGANEYFVQRGYVHVVVDVRGTGSSQGVWDSFGPAEQRDGAEVVAWTRKQEWSNGTSGLWGASYLAITQITTAAQKPEGLKAMFPIVPMGDGYRDIVFSGGQINTAFIPLWLGLVTGTGIIPGSHALSGNPADLVEAVTTIVQHLAGAGNFQLSTILNSLAGGDVAYDGAFWKTRSPIELLDQIDVPTFVVGGHHDLFQRGEPLIYERLKKRVNARLLMGPWTHVGGSSGAGLPKDGVPPIDHIALRWFDRYLKGIDTRVRDIPKVTQYVYGDEKYEVQADWPQPNLRPTRRYLREGNTLSPEKPAGAEAADSFIQQPLSGICTQSTSQWTAGLTEFLPCATDNRLDEPAGQTYTTPPAEQDLRLSGPAMANLWVTSTRNDAVLTVRVTDVAPDGKSTELTSGWLAGSFRATDNKRNRYVHGELIQPWHPFTKESVSPLTPGEAVQLPVEVFPVNATIKKGHSLRIAVMPSDFPHSLPPVPQLANSLLGKVDILHDAEHPSYVALPTLGGCDPWVKYPGKKPKTKRQRQAAKTACKPLRVPDLTRAE